MISSSNLQGQYAGFLTRIFGFIIDVLIISVIDLAVYGLVSILVLQFTGSSVQRCPSLETFNLKIITCHVAKWGLRAFVAGFPVVYFLFFWILTGQTIGHYAAGLRVIRTNGHRVRLVSGVVRFLGYFLCFFSLGLGFLWILVDDRRRGWHDKLAGTCVIYAWEARQDVRFLQKLHQQLLGKTQQSE